jgi:adenylosuccinate synthase
MSADVVLGAFYGDEGKGAVADYLLSRGDYSAVVRFQGGNNAGHTLQIEGTVYKLHILPCGIINPEILSVVGPGTVVDPRIALQELAGLREMGIEGNNLRISDIAHVILPYHRAIDYISEARRSAEEKIGSTCRGISPAYSDKINRRGIRVGDLLHREALRDQIKKNLLGEGLRDVISDALQNLELPEESIPFLEASLHPDQMAEDYFTIGQEISQYVTDTNQLLWGLLDRGKNILLEGAQGIFLDIDYGSYPFVTSSSIVPGAANTGAGIPPSEIRDVYGVLKAFGTRIDTVGPFPTLEESEVADLIIERGGEFGTTTGRRRRFGWLDLVAARYAVRLAGINKLVLTKIDGLSGVGDLRVAVAYQIDGQRVENYPSDREKLRRARPIYETLPGWSEDISGARKLEDLPPEARDYLSLCQEQTGARVALVGVGPGREETIEVPA